MSAPRHGWSGKFAAAISGIVWSIRTQNSFWVHVMAAAVAIAMAGWLGVESWRWVAIVFAITIVMSAELLNTSLEQLVVVLHPQEDQRIGRVLDVAAGAVLVAAIGAVVIGLIALGFPLWEFVAHQ